MALLDDLSKTVNNATQSALKKTKDTTEIAKISSQISTLKGQLNQAYQSLGKRYFCVYGATPAPELIQLTEDVQSLTRQISDRETEIQILKGMIRCPGCGKPLDKNAVFCTACGYKIIPEDAVICPSCHAVLDKNAAFCVSCGQKIISDESIVCPSCYAILPKDTVFCNYCGSKVNIQKPVSVPTLVTEAEGSICTNCGTAIAQDATFCTACGASVTTVLEAGPHSPICANCGATLASDAVFCTNCGLKVVGPENTDENKA